MLNIINMSGGKDSTATLLLAIERGAEGIKPVFCDTGHEHPQTYDYIAYLEQRLGLPIQAIKADFTKDIARKRLFVQNKWPEKGVSPEIVERALAILHPTGNPFLDLCVWKGRFPSTKVRFCTEELKVLPMQERIILPALKAGEEVVSWVGVRRDESAARSTLPEREREDAGNELYRPILDWTAADVFAFHAKHNVDPNPLYKQGMGRVGCMPCIMARKAELLEISKRFPEQIERVREWERIVSQASKTGFSTLFPSANGHGEGGIDEEVRWSKTSFGGRQMTIDAILEAPSCSSLYGLCE